MLLFLVICVYLKTLRGQPLEPLPPPRSEVTAYLFRTVASKSPVASTDESQQLRTVFNIVQSCLLTIFACVWTSIHPNINGLRDSWWTCTKRKMATTFCAVIAPELVFYWASRQRAAARIIAEKYNKEFAKLGM